MIKRRRNVLSYNFTLTHFFYLQLHRFFICFEGCIGISYHFVLVGALFLVKILMTFCLTECIALSELSCEVLS